MFRVPCSVYYYIYDSFLQNKKYRKTLEEIEVRLTDLGIQGKIRRLNILHHQREMIEECIRRGAKTIVLVGNDRSIAQAVDTLAKHDIAIGVIPIGDERDNCIARTLGIPPGMLACDVLSRRTIARLDLGKINALHFLTTAEMRSTTFECIGPKNAFRVIPTVQKIALTLSNLMPFSATDDAKLARNPRDGVLELIIRDATTSFADVFRTKKSQKKIPSIFPIQKLELREPEGELITLDGWHSVKLPVTVSVVPQKLRFIVGRERLFI